MNDKKIEEYIYRDKCSYPMSLFYVYQDEVPENTKVSISEDCEQCDEKKCDCEYCLITEYKTKKKTKKKDEIKKCLNYCPKCNANHDNDDIEWLETGMDSDVAWENATCKVCGCEFSEVYVYGYTEKHHNN